MFSLISFSLKSRTQQLETSLILAIGEHGQRSAQLQNYIKQLDSLQAEADLACKQAVGFIGVKTATKTLKDAQVI